MRRIIEEAMRRIEETLVCRLNSEDSDRFLAAIDRAEDEGPSEALAQLMAAYEENVEK